MTLEKIFNEFIRISPELGLKYESLAVADGEKVLLEHHFTMDKPRNIYSHTKSYMVTAVGMAISDGLLSLDTYLAELFPEYRDRLLSINARMKDLQQPFIAGYLYDVRMRGVWTLKRIMSMMDEPGYSDLDIQQGMDAVFRWRLLDREDAAADREQIIEELKAYCGMDSYATLIIYKWMLGLCGLSAGES